MKLIRFLFGLFVAAWPALAQIRSVSVDTNGVIVAPTNLFVANSNRLNQAITTGTIDTAGRGLVKSGTTLHVGQSAAYTNGLIPYVSGASSIDFAPALFYDSANGRLSIGSASSGASLLHLGQSGLTGANSGITIGTGFERNQFYSDGGGNAVLRFGVTAGGGSQSLTIQGMLNGSTFDAMKFRGSGIHDINNNVRFLIAGPSAIYGSDSSTNLIAITGTGNLVVATPDGSSGLASLRALVAADIPAHDASKITSGTMATARLGSGTANANTLLHGNQAYSAVVEADLALADNTTANVTTNAHGLLKKLPNDSTLYLDGKGNFSAVSGNVTNTSIITTNLTVRGVASLNGPLRTPFLDITGGTNFDATLSSFQGATLSANTDFNYTNGVDGTRLLLRFQENGAGGWVPTLSHVTWLFGTNNWNTNASGVNYVTVLQAGSTAEASLIGTNGATSGGDTIWTNAGGTVEISGLATNQVYVSRTNVVNTDYAFSVEGWATGNGQPSIVHVQMNDAGIPFTGFVSEVAQFINNTTGFGTLTNGGKIFNLSGAGQFGLTGDVESGTYNLDDQGAGVRGVNEGGNAIAIGVLGISSDAPGIDGQSVIGIVSSAFGTRSYSNLIGEFIQLSTTASPSLPALESAALLIDNTSSAVPLIVARTNNGTSVFSVSGEGLVSATGADITNNFKFRSGAGAGKVLISDANGAASWTGAASVNGTNVTTPNLTNSATVTWALSGSNITATSSSTGTSGSGTTNLIAKWTSTNTLGNSALTDNGTTITSTEAIRIPDGLGNAPGLAFSGETTSGFYRAAAGEVTVTVQGASVADYSAAFRPKQFEIKAHSDTTGLSPLLVQGTWNNSGVQMKGIQLSITDTASASTSYLLDASVGGSSQFTVGKGGGVRQAWKTLTLTGTNVSAVSLDTGGMFKLTLTNNAYFGVPTGLPGTNVAQTIQIHLLQDGTGGRTVTMTNSAWIIAGSGASTNAQPTINTNANGVSILTFVTSPFSTTLMYGTPTAFTP